MLGDDHVTRERKDLVERIPCDLPNGWQCDTHRLLTVTCAVVAGGHPCDQNHDSCIQNPCDQNLVTGTTMVVTRILDTRILWPEPYDQNSCNQYVRAKNHNSCVQNPCDQNLLNHIVVVHHFHLVPDKLHRSDDHGLKISTLALERDYHCDLCNCSVVVLSSFIFLFPFLSPSISLLYITGKQSELTSDHSHFLV